MCAGLKAYVNAINKKPNRKLTTAWLKGLEGILKAYLGEVPEKFTVDGKEYTPQSYASEFLKLNADDYVSITSFTHHPFYSQFAIEVPDNWRWDLSYNVPMEEMMQIFDYAIENGYTVAWGSDVSEKGFTRNGIATVPCEKGDVVEVVDECCVELPERFQRRYSVAPYTNLRCVRSNSVHGKGAEASGAEVENMEGAALFALAEVLGFRAVQIRAISNYVGEEFSHWMVYDALNALAEELVNYYE